jgi:SAM-dependent methyltransferase
MPSRENELPGKLWLAATVFAGACLLFLLEPVIAKAILPWFGGSAAVWTACMLFFQVTLLLGYLYAHWSASRLGSRSQGRVHAVLLAASLLLLPVIPSPSWKPSGAADPTLRILGLLTVTVGPPFLLLSATGPLLQAWWLRRHRATPYRLYALSNVGSLLALLGYPVLMEPWLGIRAQAMAWSAGYALFAVLAAVAGMMRTPEPAPAEPAPEPEDGPAIGWRTRLLWAGLPALASALLLAVTNHLSQNVAAIPFLWVLPLALYLVSFILCFEREAWYRRAWWLAAAAAALAGMGYALLDFDNLGLKPTLALFLAGLFCACMICHGELVRLKPHPRQLTGFYLMIALGGAIGGLFVAVGAPLLFSGTYELPLLLALFTALAAALCLRGRLHRALKAGAALAAVALVAVLAQGVRAAIKDCRVRVRNFYGSLRVEDYLQDHDTIRMLMNGAIDHGEQYLAPARSREPTTYYGTSTGIGLALRALDRPGRRLGFIGLGAGTLAAYGRAGDDITYYEINPLVPKLADREFSFLRQSPAQIQVVLGDARLSLEQEPPQGFDLLAVDAFSGDSIPVHLLTREAFQLYFRHLKEGGLLAVHISNRYLDLEPVVRKAAQELGKAVLVVDTDDDDEHDVCAATWVLVADGAARFGPELVRAAGAQNGARTGFRAWTDDYSNLYQVLR